MTILIQAPTAEWLDGKLGLLEESKKVLIELVHDVHERMLGRRTSNDAERAMIDVVKRSR